MAGQKKRRRRVSTLEKLRRRLREAEDTLKAIREGHVEALVVATSEGDQIYTLRSADQPYRLMVEQMREGAVTLSGDGTVLYCNQRFAELVGFSPERVVGRGIAEYLDLAESPDLQSLIDADSFRGEFQLQTAGGRTIPAQLSSSAMTIDDVRTVAVVVTDMRHERTERALIEANRMKDEFLATLSHELRTPLNVILGWSRMLMEEQLSDEARQRGLELIDRNAQLQAQLVNDLVDMSRIATGKMKIKPEALPIVPALEAALETVRPAAEEKRIRVETSWHAEDAVVLADATRLQQVLWNLLSNAVKFTPEGGSITFAADCEDDRIRIAVTDTGIGIDPAFLPFVFDRFRQADSATTRRFGGLGLGLAIVQDLVQLHGGEVEVHSPGVGQGATFVVTLRGSAPLVGA
jgi:PAS domain S-box-containing protein